MALLVVLAACRGGGSDAPLEGALARVGSARLDAPTLQATLQAHPEWTAEQARDAWVRTALLGEAALARGVSHESRSNALVRRLYAHWGEAALRPPTATAAEIATARREEWQTFDRPAARVVHHVVVRKGRNADADFLHKATDLLRPFASQVGTGWDFARFEQAAKALSLPAGSEIRVEQLPAFIADGRQTEGQGGFDPTFVAEAFKLHQAGEVSPPFETPFGVHVIQLERTLPAESKTDDEIRVVLDGELLKRRLARVQGETVDRQRNSLPITVEPSAAADMEKLVSRMLGDETK